MRLLAVRQPKFVSLAHVALIGIAIGVVPSRTLQAEDELPRLRYKWEVGKQYPYSVSIRATVLPSRIVETMEGTPIYKVLSSQNGLAVVSVDGRLAHDLLDPKGNPIPGGKTMYAKSRELTGIEGTGPSRAPHQLQIDEVGDVIGMRSSSALPFLLGHASLLVPQSVPETPQRTWTVEKQQTADTVAGGDSKDTAANRNAGMTQRSTYTLTKWTDAEAILKKEFELKATDNLPSGAPKFSLIGDGQVKFDRQRGLVSSVEMMLKASMIAEGEPLKLEIAIDIKYLGDDYFKRLAAEEEARKHLTPEELKQLISDLKASDGQRMPRAVIRLKQIIPTESDRAAISAVLLGSMLPGPGNDNSLSGWIHDLHRWVTVKDVPVLIKLLNNPKTTNRDEIIRTLGVLRDKRAIEPLFARFKEPRDVLTAGFALEKFGADAEKGAFKFLASKDAKIRKAAYRIVQRGTSDEGEAALRKALEKETDKDAREACQHALAARAETAGRATTTSIAASSPSPTAPAPSSPPTRTSGAAPGPESFDVGDKVLVELAGKPMVAEIVEVLPAKRFKVRSKSKFGEQLTGTLLAKEMRRAPAAAIVGSPTSPESAEADVLGTLRKFNVGDLLLVGHLGDVYVGEIIEVLGTSWYRVRFKDSDGKEKDSIFPPRTVLPSPAELSVGAPPHKNAGDYQPGDKVVVDVAGLRVGEFVRVTDRGQIEVNVWFSPNKSGQTRSLPPEKVYPAPAEALGDAK